MFTVWNVAEYKKCVEESLSGTFTCHIHLPTACPLEPEAE